MGRNFRFGLASLYTGFFVFIVVRCLVSPSSVRSFYHSCTYRTMYTDRTHSLLQDGLLIFLYLQSNAWMINMLNIRAPTHLNVPPRFRPTMLILCKVVNEPIILWDNEEEGSPLTEWRTRLLSNWTPTCQKKSNTLLARIMEVFFLISAIRLGFWFTMSATSPYIRAFKKVSLVWGNDYILHSAKHCYKLQK